MEKIDYKLIKNKPKELQDFLEFCDNSMNFSVSMSGMQKNFYIFLHRNNEEYVINIASEGITFFEKNGDILFENMDKHIFFYIYKELLKNL